MSTDPSADAAPGAPHQSGALYRHAHWYFLVAFVAIVGGFWQSFFRSLSGGSAAHTLHGVTATLWVLALIAQSLLMAKGKVQWHHRVGRVAVFVLLPILVISALRMVALMFANPGMPPFLPPLLAFIDLPSLAFLVALVMLALWNVRRPAAHQRFMAATVLLAFPPALTRLYAMLFAPALDFMQALHLSFATVHAVLIALIIADWRAGERQLAYPLSLGFFVLLQSLMGPVSGSDAWARLMAWYVAAL